MDRTEEVNKTASHNYIRIMMLREWVTAHNKVKSKHEWYMVGIALMSFLALVIAVVK